ncbi:MAG: hypothetical protein WCV56_03650 [Candidatus Omnitrophota bacterium]
MTLKEFLEFEKKNIGLSELGRRLGRSRQCVDITLRRSVDGVGVGTLREYARALGVRKKLIL